MKLQYLGNDRFDRPVYKDESERLWKDVEPRADRESDLCTYYNNEVDGEPDTNMRYIKRYENIEIEYIPYRITW